MSFDEDKDTEYDVQINGFDPDQFDRSRTQIPPQEDTKRQTNADRKDAARQQLLTSLLAYEVKLTTLATKPVVFSPPLISRQEVGIIGRNTVNIIQGAFGSHKSRLAELLAALMLTDKANQDTQFLEFKKAMLERFCVCYIDTERNQSEELPHAIQGIKLKAGYKLEDKPSDFRFTSIKAVDRINRFEAIAAFISHVRQQTALHLFVLIDVVTDAIGDFNDPKESMKLFDFLGNLCDNYDATFLLVIHQNPGTEKARGHTGTEAANKASTVLQIGFEKTDKGEDSELIKVRYLKLRRGKRPEPIYLQFSTQANGLMLASAEALTAYSQERQQKAPLSEVAEQLETLLSEGAMTKGLVVEALMKHFAAGNRTIRDRLKEVGEQHPDVYDSEGRAVQLQGYSEGKCEYYRLGLIV